MRELLKKFCCFLVALCCVAVLGNEKEPVELKLQPVSMKMSGLFAEGQKFPETEQVVPHPGWNEVPSVVEQCPPSLLVDGSAAWVSCVKTYFWTSHDKKLEIIFDLGAVKFVDQVAVYQSTLYPGCLIEECEVSCSSELGNDDLWSTPVVVKQTEIQQPTWQEAAYPLEFSLRKDCRYIKVLCTAVQNGCIILAEVKAFGSEEPAGTEIEFSVPQFTTRFEAENMKGGYYPAAPDFNGGKGIWIVHDTECAISLPEVPEGQVMNSWLRQFNYPMLVSINGNKVETPQTSGWRWVRGPSFKGGEVTLQFSEKSQLMTGTVDSVIFTADPDFDPNKIDDRQYIGRIPEIKRNAYFSETLRADNPDITPEDFAERLLRHYGKQEFRTGQPRDKYGNMLHQGKPMLPHLLWMSRPEDDRSKKLGLDCFLTRRPEEFHWENEKQMAVKMFADVTAFDSIAQDLLKTDPDRIAFMYMADEPDGQGIGLWELQSLNALCKKALPDVPTFLNFASGSAMRAAFNIGDFVGLDHYPVNMGRVADIGYSVDYMRHYSGNTPLLFIAQAFNWGSFGGMQGRWPTPDEFTAMYLLSLVHGSRGVLFYDSHKEGPNSIQAQGEIYERLQEAFRLLTELQAGIAGPEVKMPCTIVPANSTLAPEFRFLVSADRTQVWLMAVNAHDKNASATLSMGASFMQGMELVPMLNHGVESQGNEFLFAPFATAVWHVRGIDGKAFEEYTESEIMDRLSQRFKRNENAPEAVVQVTSGNEPDWSQATNLIDTWKSDRRMEKALVTADQRGLYIDAAFRFRADRTSVCTERDGDVWADLSLEIFIGKPAALQYVHLMVNSLNVQADYYFNHESGIPMNRIYDYDWQSSVNVSRENIEFLIFIPYESLEKMTGASRGEMLGFNIATGGWEDKDWAGLSGSGFQAPLKFGRLIFKK